MHSHDVLQRLSHEVMIKKNAIVARSFGTSAGIDPRIWLVSRDLMLGSERSDICARTPLAFLIPYSHLLQIKCAAAAAGNVYY